jgi:bifunctional DNA-binding transcriptional regulator/antitoxin component of YhaV-PrlF toxin-antitoxin module|tara:strand:+ start:316 stop:456 length:141 start_codon:yes stop_codon:yes gene_type:complete
MEFETFYDELKEHNKVLRVTVPYKLVEFAGLKTGDKVKVMIRKMEE